jgi:phytoene synthase
MSGALLWVICPKENAGFAATTSYSLVPKIRAQVRSHNSKGCSRLNFSSGVFAAASLSSAVANPPRSSVEKVYEVVLKQAALVKEQKKERALDVRKEKGQTDSMTRGDLLNGAYNRCGEVCAEYAKTFYLGICSLVLSLPLFLSSSCLCLLTIHSYQRACLTYCFTNKDEVKFLFKK